MKIDKKQAGMWMSLGFVLGIIVAGLVLKTMIHRHRGSFAKHHARALERMSGKLGLDETQETALKTILDEKFERRKEMHAAARAKGDAMRVSFRAEVKEILKPEQIETFDKMAKSWDQRHEKRRKKGWHH